MLIIIIVLVVLAAIVAVMYNGLKAAKYALMKLERHNCTA